VYGRDLRLHETSFFYNSFKWMQLLLEAPTEKYALKAEGIIHRIPHSIMYDDLEKDRRIAVSLITKIPMPAAVIYLTCDMEENAKRLVTRKFVWDGHRNLSLTKLKEYSRRSHEKRNMIIDVLQDHRVPILKVDTTEGLAKSTERILAFINSL
jgi:thymidylate kinase